MYRIGFGFDQHKYIKGKQLVLGSVKIDHPMGLEAHSDGDALLHAICDALLGAMGRGDIGQWFPDTDPQFKDADSSLFVRHVMKMIERDSYEVENLDTLVITEQPHLSNYKQAIKERIADLLQIGIDRINVKATRPEKIGALGAGEGLAVQAVVLIRKKS